MKKLKFESGRSMVEMLGVLAIIGVLSIGGIAGYSLSMRKHRANQIADLASKFALIGYGKCQNYEKYSDDIDCGITFEEAGVGNLPAGVKEMSFDLTDASSGTGPDEIQVMVEFNDEKLCQATAIIAGQECMPDSYDGDFDTTFYIFPE